MLSRSYVKKGVASHDQLDPGLPDLSHRGLEDLAFATLCARLLAFRGEREKHL